MLCHYTCNNFGTYCKGVFAMIKESHAWLIFYTELKEIAEIEKKIHYFKILCILWVYNGTDDSLARTAESFHRFYFIGCFILVWLFWLLFFE